MPIFILLSTLTQQGVTTLKSNPERLREVNKDVEELGCRVLHQWATLGSFDFVNVVEAPDIATVAKVSVVARRARLDEDRDAAGARDRRVPATTPASRPACASVRDRLWRRPGPLQLPLVRDPRIDDYARLLVGRSVGVQPGWQVQVRATPLARPLVEAVLEEIARRGAYPLLQMSFELIGGPFARAAPLETAARPGAAAAAHLGGGGRLHLDLGAGEHARGLGPVRGAEGGAAGSEHADA